MNEVDNAVVADCIECALYSGVVLACVGVLGYLAMRQNRPQARRRPLTLGEALLLKHNRKGFTLLEMLVSVAITMIVMLAIAQIFMYLGNNMDKGRALIEMSGQLRNVTHRLQTDLDGVTASTMPWTRADAGDGYFEYIEGVGKDSDGLANIATHMQGDVDDVLAFTARSNGNPFVGRRGGNVIESEVAEIIWWVSADANGVRSINRRVLLVRPDIPNPAATDDISQSGGKANSLADLTLREKRTLHAAAYPHAMNTAALVADTSRETVLSNVMAFDVRAYDPVAPLASGTISTLAPGDPGYATPNGFNPTNWTPVGRGAYVDLNYAGNRTVSLYSGPPNGRVPHATSPGILSVPTYSTWPMSYEHDGIDQDGDGTVDQGRDGVNQFADHYGTSQSGITVGANGSDDEPNADDVAEYETRPPYPHSIIGSSSGAISDAGHKSPGLRGIQVRIRMNEPGSRQVRQSTVIGSFTLD